MQFGKYLLLDRISVGGMAEVFRAKTSGLEGFQKIVALKRILPSMGEDRDFIRMFVDEAKIAGQLTHANIAQIFELGKVDEAHFIAMEFVWGKDLLQIQNRFRKRKETMPVAMACYILAKACEGLDYAHRKRDPLGRPLEIIHRDCSPQNILVTYEGEVKVIDFGIAKAASRVSRTSAGVLKGKFSYMSPEQVRGLPLDRRSDIFSLGTVFHECLTGHRLFSGESDFSTLEKVRAAQIPSLRDQLPDAPEAVERIVTRALAREPADRYQWCGEMHADLLAFLTSQKDVFSAKSLGDWVKEAFADERAREGKLLDSYRRHGIPGGSDGGDDDDAVIMVSHRGADGSVDDSDDDEEDAETLAVPPVPISEVVAAADRAIAARGSAVRRGSGRSEDIFDDGPTELFGEIGIEDILAADRERDLEPEAKIVVSAGGSTPRPMPLSPPEVDTAKERRLARDTTPNVPEPTTVTPPPSPAFQPWGEALDAPRPTMSTAAVLAARGRVPEAPAKKGAGRLPRLTHAVRLRFLRARAWFHRNRPAWMRHTLTRDIAIGIALAAVVLGLFAVGAWLLGDDETAAAATGTVALSIGGDDPADVYLDGEKIGVVEGGAMRIEQVAAGQHEVRIKRAGAPACTRSVAVIADKVVPITCAAPALPGLLVLDDARAGDEVLVDGKKVAVDATREAIKLSSGTAHEVVIRRGGSDVAKLSVTVAPGQAIKRSIDEDGGAVDAGSP